MATKKLVPPGYPPGKVGIAIKRNVSRHTPLNMKPVTPHLRKLSYGDQLPLPDFPFEVDYKVNIARLMAPEQGTRH